MNEKLYQNVIELKQLLKNDSRIKRLDELDKLINSNEEVMALAYQKDMAALAYEDALKIHKEDSKEVGEAMKLLHEKKLALDSNELVKEYNKTYSEVRQLYYEINSLLFSFVDSKMCPKE